MTSKEWKTIVTDYLFQSQEFVFHYGHNTIINLCWSGDDVLPYEANVCIRKKRFFLPDKWVLIRSEHFASQKDLLNNFKIDNKLLEELYPFFD